MGDALDQGQEQQCHGEAQETIDQERGDEHHERDRELDPGVHPVDEGARVHELPEDDVALQLEHYATPNLFNSSASSSSSVSRSVGKSGKSFCISRAPTTGSGRVMSSSTSLSASRRTSRTGPSMTTVPRSRTIKRSHSRLASVRLAEHTIKVSSRSRCNLVRSSRSSLRP